MTLRHSLFVPLALLASTLSAALLSAQDAAAAPVPVAATAKPAPEPVTVTLSFPGGTMGEFVDMVRNREAKANIVVATAAAAARLPAMDLRGAGLDQALEAACSVATGDSLIRVKDFHGPGETIYSIMAATDPRHPTVSVAERPEVSTEVLSLNALTADAGRQIGFEVPSILSCIETAAGCQGGVPSLRFHKETGLLIVTGTAEQINLTRAVLGNLAKDVEMRRQRALQAANEAKAAGKQGDK